MHYRNLLAKYIFKAQEKHLNRNTFCFLEELQQTQWLTSKRLEKIQIESLHKLLEHAYTSVPYYKKIMDEYDCPPSKIKNLDDLKLIPSLTKKIIRENSLSLMSDQSKKLGMRSTCTTGSTGQYLELSVSAERSAFNNALELRNREWLGVDPFGKKMLLWGRAQSDKKFSIFIRKVRDILVNKKKYLCDSLNIDEAEAFIHEVHKWNPEYLYCYAGSIAYISRLLSDNKIPMYKNQLKGIITTAEVLLDYQRKMIIEAFATKVFNEYGSAECGLIAHECEEGSLHINSEGVIVEIDNSEGCTHGELVVTVLRSYGMPIIRYRMGDVGELMIDSSKCACGRGLPVLKSLMGRTVDAMYSKSGARLDSLVIDTIAEDSSVLLFRIHQESFTDISLLLAVSEKYDKTYEMKVVANLEKLFGYKLNCDFEYRTVEDLKGKGKFRHITSDVIM